MARITCSKIMCGIGLGGIASIASAQANAIEIVDYNCLIGKPISCTVDAGFEVNNKWKRPVTEYFPKLESCFPELQSSIPVECKKLMYSAAEIDRLLSEQAKRNREQTIRLCKQVAEKPEKCDQAVPKSDSEHK